MAWIFLNDAMLSIVAPKGPENADLLLVRARAEGDIQRVFPDAEVHRTEARDYRYRTLLPRQEVAIAIAKRIAGISYGNFKDSTREQDRHDAYLGCWTSMFRFQADRERARAARQAKPRGKRGGKGRAPGRAVDDLPWFDDLPVGPRDHLIPDVSSFFAKGKG